MIRLGDAKPMHLAHAMKADGRWRLIAFAPSGDEAKPGGDIALLCRFLEEELVPRFTPADVDCDDVLDVRAVFQTPHRDIAFQNLPDLLMPKKGKHGLNDYKRAFCPDLKSGTDIFDHWGVNLGYRTNPRTKVSQFSQAAPE